MLRKLFKKYREKTYQSGKTINDKEITKQESQFDIHISKENNIFKFEITDYVQLIDCIMKVKSIGANELYEQISFNILWNGNKQKINKGTYYIITAGDSLYNILFNGEILKIDERTRKLLDEQTKRENITEEKIITINTVSGDYNYCHHKHDKSGSTFYTKLYSKNKTFGIEFFDLSSEEAFQEINQIINNLESIEEINNILNIELLKTSILGDLSIKSPKKIKKV